MKTKFKNLKKLDLSNTFVSLAIVKEYKRKRVSHYNVKYVKTDEKLEKRLRNIVIRHVDNSNTFEEYSFDCPEPEEDQVRTLQYEGTDFYQILEKLQNLNPEEDVIEDIDELLKAKAYLIVLRDIDGIQIAAFRTMPESWKMKEKKGLIHLLYRENRFEDLDNEPVFSIASSIDFIYYDELLLILSKKNFEQGLNFRDGMIAKAQELYDELEEQKVFMNLDILTKKVGNNQRYLRKVATIKNLGHYKNQEYLQKLKEVNTQKNWGLIFENGQIVISEESLDTILTVLQDKRLHSELSEADYDVESAKPLNNE